MCKASFIRPAGIKKCQGFAAKGYCFCLEKEKAKERRNISFARKVYEFKQDDNILTYIIDKEYYLLSLKEAELYDLPIVTVYEDGRMKIRESWEKTPIEVKSPCLIEFNAGPNVEILAKAYEGYKQCQLADFDDEANLLRQYYGRIFCNAILQADADHILIQIRIIDYLIKKGVLKNSREKTVYVYARFYNELFIIGLELSESGDINFDEIKILDVLPFGIRKINEFLSMVELAEHFQPGTDSVEEVHNIFRKINIL